MGYTFKGWSLPIEPDEWESIFYYYGGIGKINYTLKIILFDHNGYIKINNNINLTATYSLIGFD